MKALGSILFRICFINEFRHDPQVTESYSVRASKESISTIGLLAESSLTLITSGVGVTVSQRP